MYVQNGAGKSLYLHAEISITDLSLTKQHLVVTNERQIVVHKITNQEKDLEGSNENMFSVNAINSFSAESVQLFIHEENIIALGQMNVKIYSIGGVVLRQINFNDTEGKTCMYR